MNMIVQHTLGGLVRRPIAVSRVDGVRCLQHEGFEAVQQQGLKGLNGILRLLRPCGVRVAYGISHVVVQVAMPLRQDGVVPEGASWHWRGAGDRMPNPIATRLTKASAGTG